MLVVCAAGIFAVPGIAGAADTCPIVPVPKDYRELGSTIELTKGAAIVVGSKATEPEKYAAERLQKLIHRRFKRKLAVVTEDKADNEAQLIGLGQFTTHGLVKKLCADANIDMAAIAAKSESRDGFAIEAAKGKKVILVAGSNPRGVIYGADVFFDLLRAEGDRIVFPAVSIRDWPSIPWRGRASKLVGRLELLDVFVRSRLNVIKISTKGSLLYSLSLEQASAVLKEAHRRGLFVYGMVSGMGKPDARRKCFEELIALGVDGLWISFDDQGYGKDAPKDMIEMLVDVARKRAIPLKYLAITPSGKGNYDEIGTKWNRKHVKVPGFEQATFFITTPPSKKLFETAKEIGLKRPPGWWHNWPRYDSGLLYKCYAGDSLRHDKPAYKPLVPLEIGWDRPKYDDLRDAGDYSKVVGISFLPGSMNREYFATTFGIWAWEPEKHNWEGTKQTVYGHVFGRAQSAAAAEFDDCLLKLTSMFRRQPFSGAGGYPPGHRKRKHAWPPRLKDLKARPQALSLINTMEKRLEVLEKASPSASMLETERLRTYFLEPMRATVHCARSMGTIEYPEYTLPKGFINDLKELALSGDTDTLEKRMTESRQTIVPVMDRVEKELGDLKGVSGYVKKWRDAVSGTEYWADVQEQEARAMKKRLEKYKTYEDLFSRHDKQKYELLKNIGSPPKGKVLTEIKPGEWKAKDDNAVYWRGKWAVGKRNFKGKDVLLISTENYGKAGDYADIRTEIQVPEFGKKCILDLFAGHTVVKHANKPLKDRWFMEVWAGNNKIAQEDLADPHTGGKWFSFDITEAAKNNDRIDIKVRIRGFYKYYGIKVLVGPVQLRSAPGLPKEAGASFRVRDFGAKGDGKTLDTAAIQKALDACGADGGTVRFSKGTYLSGALFMKSETTLHLNKGAVLKGSGNLKHYPMIDSRWNGTEQKCSASLINAKEASGLTITGKGEIAGSGAGDSKPPAGPRVIEFIRCKDILIENIRVTNRGRWTIHPIYCTNVIARGLTVRTTGQNADGFNPDSCNGVLVTECTFQTGDDCIAIKSGKNQQAVDIGIPCENITITKCTMTGGHGGVVIGSEMSGGIRNITVKDCLFKWLPRGIRLKTRRGRGGVVENLHFSGIEIVDTRNPIVLNMKYTWNPGKLIPGKAGIPKLRNITIENVTIKTKAKRGDGMGFMHGMEDSPIEGLTLRNISSDGNGKLSLKNIRGLTLEKVRNKKGEDAVTMENVHLEVDAAQ